MAFTQDRSLPPSIWGQPQESRMLFLTPAGRSLSRYAASSLQWGPPELSLSSLKLRHCPFQSGKLSWSVVKQCRGRGGGKSLRLSISSSCLPLHQEGKHRTKHRGGFDPQQSMPGLRAQKFLLRFGTLVKQNQRWASPIWGPPAAPLRGMALEGGDSACPGLEETGCPDLRR